MTPAANCDDELDSLQGELLGRGKSPLWKWDWRMIRIHLR